MVNLWLSGFGYRGWMMSWRGCWFDKLWVFSSTSWHETSFQLAVFGVGKDWDEVAFNQEGQACAEGLLHRAFCFPGLGFHITMCNTFAFFAETCFKSSWVVCTCLPPAERAALSGWTNAQQWAGRDEKGDLQADPGASPAGHHHCVGGWLHLGPGAAAQSRDWKSREESSGAQGKKGTRLLCCLFKGSKGLEHPAFKLH